MPQAPIHIHQFNLHAAVGGGEIYTRWLTRAMADSGARVTLYVHPANRLWDDLGSDRIEIIRVSREGDAEKHLPPRGALVLTQTRIPDSLFELARRDHILTGFSHMPALGRSAAEFLTYRTVFTVSNYCIDLLRRAGVSQVYPVPLYGVAELDRPLSAKVRDVLVARSPYDWDRRKVRDLLMGAMEPLIAAIGTGAPVFRRRPGLTFGIVSLLSPIKQFPALFSQIASKLALYPQVNLEIFGDGGYAQVRDIKSALAPIANRVRFWGRQDAVGHIYPKLDYLLTGLAEKEALGLNVIEAQGLGTPVLAPRAPPFTETVLHGETGFLYRDPREDSGEDFGSLLASLAKGRLRPDPVKAFDHMAKFTYGAMLGRVHDMIEVLSDMKK